MGNKIILSFMDYTNEIRNKSRRQPMFTKRPLLCRIGFHKWKFVYNIYNGGLCEGRMFKCRKCRTYGHDTNDSANVHNANNKGDLE